MGDLWSLWVSLLVRERQDHNSHTTKSSVGEPYRKTNVSAILHPSSQTVVRQTTMSKKLILSSPWTQGHEPSEHPAGGGWKCMQPNSVQSMNKTFILVWRWRVAKSQVICPNLWRDLEMAVQTFPIQSDSLRGSAWKNGINFPNLGVRSLPEKSPSCNCCQRGFWGRNT